jgi:serine/threonine protein kinase
MNAPPALGTYEPLVFLGEGGMAEVWLARQHRAEGVQRTVVLKHLKRDLVADRDTVLAFLDEARLLARLSHPHLVQLLDLEIVDDTYALVLEHVDGIDLRELLRGRAAPLPIEAALAIARPLAEALAYVHACTDELGDPLGVVHRDVNPSNVLVGKNGAVKLIDFGIATATIHEHRTRTGVRKGTSGYVAPEQISDDPKVDARADVFSFGAILYELLAGEPAFAAGGGLADARTNAAEVPITKVRDIDPALAVVVERCLDRDRDRRYANGGEVVRALAAISDRAPCTMLDLGALVNAATIDRPTEVVADRVVARRPRAAAPSRASPRMLAVLAFALVAAVAAAAYFVGRWLAS